MLTDPLLHAFDRTVSRAPTAPLLLGEDGCLTREELDAAARAAGRALEGAVAPGEAVALDAHDAVGFLAGLVALLRAGSGVLLVDTTTRGDVRASTAAGLGARRVFHALRDGPRLPSHWRLEPVPGCDRPLSCGSGRVVKLSSGTTGVPRGIVAPVECLVADDDALRRSMGIRDDDRLLVSVPLAHSYGLSSLAVPALTRGIRLVSADPRRLLSPVMTSRRHEATVFPTVPAFLDALVRLAEPPPLPASIRLVLTAGAPLAAETSLAFRERLGLPVHVFYGASECGGIAYDREGGAAERGTVGAPLEGVRIELEGVEDDSGDRIGERVIVRSGAVAERYSPDPDDRLAGGRFATGDLGGWKGGELELRGRLDDVVNIHGRKILPAEIEAVLAAVPGVFESRVLGVPPPSPGDPVLRAVVACDPERVSRSILLDRCRAVLPPHKVPRSLILVERLPRTARGKVDRNALARLRG